jgi:DinB superfamily
MKELLDYRVKMMARLSQAAQEFRAACEAIKDPFAKVDGKWSLHQIASHVRDVEKFVYGERIHRTLNESNPELKSFDAEGWMKRYKTDEPLAEILNKFSSNVETLCKTLSELPQEAWSRESRHETRGGQLTLQLWVEHNLAHIEEHLQTVKKG